MRARVGSYRPGGPDPLISTLVAARSRGRDKAGAREGADVTRGRAVPHLPSGTSSETAGLRRSWPGPWGSGARRLARLQGPKREGRWHCRVGAAVRPPPPQSRGTAEPLGRLRGRSIRVIKHAGGGVRGQKGNAQVPGISVGSQIHTNSVKKENSGGRGALLAQSSRRAAWF